VDCVLSSIRQTEKEKLQSCALLGVRLLLRCQVCWQPFYDHEKSQAEEKADRRKRRAAWIVAEKWSSSAECLVPIA
jgi:hypothetical protein